MSISNHRLLIVTLAAVLGTVAVSDLSARQVQGATRTSVGGSANRSANANVNRNVNANANANVNRNVNANSNVNVNRNVNVNSNVNVNRDVNVNVDNNWNNHWDHPVAAAAAVGTAVAVTAAAIGSIAYSVPPSCVPVVVNGVTFQQCGSTWYQPQYAGSSVQYVVVTAPR
jgi:UDP-3-O-[3-hydroxymyristoyl] glucosamine N-acyltransferase